MANNKTDSFPTVVAMIKNSNSLNQKNDLLQFSMQMIKQHRPKRVLLLCHWPVYYCRNLFGKPECDYDRFDSDIQYLVEYIKEIQSLGVEVSTLTINFHHRNFHPAFMVEFIGIIDENVRAI